MANAARTTSLAKSLSTFDFFDGGIADSGVFIGVLASSHVAVGTSYNADFPDGRTLRPMTTEFAYRHRAKRCITFF